MPGRNLIAAMVCLCLRGTGAKNTCRTHGSISRDDCVGQGIPSGDWVSCGWCESYAYGGGVGSKCSNSLQGSALCGGSWIRTMSPPPPPPPPRGAFGSSADMAFSMSDDEAQGALIIVVIVVIIVVVVVAVGSSIKRSHRSKAASGQRGAGQCRANSALPPALPHHHRPQVPLVSAQYAGEYSQSYCAPVAVARVDGTKQQLLQLNVKQLRTRAAAIGISSAEVEAARDGDDPKHELVALILSHSR
jgi:hypothetical protein